MSQSNSSSSKKPALITPSASPPRKRPKHNTPDDPILEQSRRASTHKLAVLWDGLAKKYALPVDEDDIVDMRTGKLSHDRGVLRSAPRDWDIGCFWEAQIANNDADAATATVDSEEEDSADELDFLAPSPIKAFKVPVVPPISEDDAADLAEFLRDEKRRREEAGELTDADDATSDDGLTLEEEESVEEPLDTHTDTQSDAPFLEDDESARSLHSDTDDEISAWPPLSSSPEKPAWTPSPSPSPLPPPTSRKLQNSQPFTPSTKQSRVIKPIPSSLPSKGKSKKIYREVSPDLTPATPPRARERSPAENDIIEIFSSPEAPISPEVPILDYRKTNISPTVMDSPSKPKSVKKRTRVSKG